MSSRSLSNEPFSAHTVRGCPAMLFFSLTSCPPSVQSDRYLVTFLAEREVGTTAELKSWAVALCRRNLISWLCSSVYHTVQIKVILGGKASLPDLLALCYSLAHYQEQLGKICWRRVPDLAHLFLQSTGSPCTGCSPSLGSCSWLLVHETYL